MRKITREQRRARLGLRHHLASPSHHVSDVVESLVAVHSSDPPSVFLGMWARLQDFMVEDLEVRLYDERSLVRLWGMRRTLWVVSRDMVPLVVNSTTHSLGERERSRTAKLIEEGGVSDDGERWIRTNAPKVVAAIGEHGEVLTRQLSREMPELAARITFTNRAGRVVGTTGMASRILVQLAMESQLVRTRPAGTWLSGQYRWALTKDWLGEPVAKLSRREASARLIQAWLRSYGPATETDVKWWTGWTVRQVRDALSDVAAAEVELAGEGIGYVLADDIDDVLDPDPWVAPLPSLDTTTMGWKERDWYLGEHSARLFDRNGNAGPTVWVDGRVVGGWAQSQDGHLVYELLEDVGSEAVSAIENRLDGLERWFGGITVTPRFRTPHVDELTGR